MTGPQCFSPIPHQPPLPPGPATAGSSNVVWVEGGREGGQVSWESRLQGIQPGAALPGLQESHGSRYFPDLEILNLGLLSPGIAGDLWPPDLRTLLCPYSWAPFPPQMAARGLLGSCN